MAASNRAKLITKLHSELKKKFALPPSQPSRPLLEHFLYACLLQDAPYDLADEGLAKCEQEFFDWNEVRVTTVTELTQVLAGMPDPPKTARRLKDTLQAIFEAFYTFDLDHLKKENLGKAVAKFEAMPAITPFVLSYAVQHGLGGHSIPVDYAAMVIMLATGVASQNEASDGKIPGLERAIPKNKAVEFSALLHQAGVALMLDHNDKKARGLIDAVAKGASGRYDDWEASKKAAIRRVKKRIRDEKVAAEQDADQQTETAKPEKGAKSAKKRAAKVEDHSGDAGAQSAAATPATAPKKTKSGTSKKTDDPDANKEAKKTTPKSPDAVTPKPAKTKTAKSTPTKATPVKATPSKSSAAKKSTSRKLTKRKPR